MSNCLPRTAAFASLIVIFVCACSSAPVLDPKSAAAPPNIDFSGYWTLRKGPAAMRLPRDGQGVEPLLPTARKARRQRRGDNVPVRVFLEYGEHLKFTQTPYGIFISYDRAVVDEFTFGEHREIAIGPIEARRVSGWEGDVFVVETLDLKRNRLIEHWRYQATDDTLIRQVRIVENDKETYNLQQIFDRQS